MKRKVSVKSMRIKNPSGVLIFSVNQRVKSI